MLKWHPAVDFVLRNRKQLIVFILAAAALLTAAILGVGDAAPPVPSVE